MEHLDYPSKKTWDLRREWFEALLFKHEERGSFLVSEQACALIAEVQSCFCAGAWVSVIILAFTVVEAQLRETEVPDFKGNSKQLLETLGFDEKFQQLRIRRNRLIHLDLENPAITVDQQWKDRDKLKKEAEEAIQLMLEAFFSNPGT
ncbi:MAG: hypothetical protein NPINA01_16470 [Nitrospinaceae bacterium]|nr:MAG: hypothetical protein NPINA01_16470 [Nitrospinaceae bacterium]